MIGLDLWDCSKDKRDEKLGESRYQEMPIKAVFQFAWNGKYLCNESPHQSELLGSWVSTGIQPALQLGIPEGHLGFCGMHQGFECVPVVK